MKQQVPAPAVDNTSRFLWWMAAADAQTLKDCRADRERYRIIGTAVLITWMFATLSWGYFFSTVVEDDLLVGLLSLFFGFAILSIDRSLIAAMTRKHGREAIAPAVFRMLLAITIGLFISQPVVLMLFKKDIQAQMAINKQTKMDAFKAQLAASSADLKMALEQQQTFLQNELKKQQTQVKAYKDGYIQETDGTGGSGKIGASEIARIKKNEYLKAEGEWLALEGKIQPQLEELSTRLKQLADQNQQKEKAYAATLTDGFLTQVTALNDLMTQNNTLRLRYRLVVFIITLIEVLPLLSKLLMPKGEYEEMVACNVAADVAACQLNMEHTMWLQEYFHETAAQQDKELVDRIFSMTADMRQQQAGEVVKSWNETNGKQYQTLWNNARKSLFIHKV